MREEDRTVVRRVIESIANAAIEGLDRSEIDTTWMQDILTPASTELSIYVTNQYKKRGAVDIFYDHKTDKVVVQGWSESHGTQYCLSDPSLIYDASSRARGFIRAKLQEPVEHKA